MRPLIAGTMARTSVWYGIGLAKLRWRNADATRSTAEALRSMANSVRCLSNSRRSAKLELEYTAKAWVWRVLSVVVVVRNVLIEVLHMSEVAPPTQAL